MKKAWKKPQLVVLTRGKPEEAVLAVCKTAEPGGGGSEPQAFWCMVTGCTDCTDMVGS